MQKIIFLLLLVGCTSTGPKCKCEKGAYQPDIKACEERFYIMNPCTMQYDPVCGCDGSTYGNACEANQNGIVWSVKGACSEQKNEK